MLYLGPAIVWIYVSNQNSLVEILTAMVMVLGGGAFGGWLDHEGGDFMNGISAHKRDPMETPYPSTMWAHSEKTAV